MVYFLYGTFFLSCIALIAAVLLQPGKTDAGALFTSNVSSSAFAPRGTATVLSKVTIIAATLFMLSALLLAMPALNGNISVLSANPDAPADANTNSNAPDANANTAPASNVEIPLANLDAPATNTPEANAPVVPAANANAPATNIPAKSPAKK